jgi:hypothetical protein
MSFKQFYTESMQQWAGDKLYDGYTSVDSDHNHLFEVNASGDGVALAVKPGDHQHNVVGWKIQESGGHIHTITEDQQT